MQRTIIHLKGEQLQFIREAQNKLTGNAAQRKQQLKIGHHLNWHMTQKRTVSAVIECGFVTSTEEGAVVYNENEHIAEKYRNLSDSIVGAIESQINSFELKQSEQTNCPCCGVPLGQMTEEEKQECRLDQQDDAEMQDPATSKYGYMNLPGADEE